MADDDTMQTGPFGLVVSEDDAFGWNFYYKPGATPTDDQLALAEAIFALSEKLSGFQQDPASAKMRQDLQGLFSATLVQYFAGDLQRHLAHVASREKAFFRTIVTPLHRRRRVETALRTA